MKKKEFYQYANESRFLLFFALVTCLIILGCSSFGSISLHNAVMKYDDAVLQSEQQSLLLNILRMHDDQPPHFTAASGVQATFTLSSPNTLAGTIGNNSNPAPTSLASTLTLGGTYTESPTITISPMQGKDFADRLLGPIDPTFVKSILLQQGTDKLEKMLRLTGADFFIIGPKESAKIFEIISNAEGSDTSPKSVSEATPPNGVPNSKKSDTPKKSVSEAIKSKPPENVSEGTNNSCGKEVREKNPFKCISNFEGLEKTVYKYPFEDVKNIILKMDDETENISQEEKVAKRDEAIGKLIEKGFSREEAYCLSEDACFIKNTPAKIISAENKDREKDVMYYELFRKIVLHIKAVQLSDLLFYSLIDIPIQSVEGTTRKDIDFGKDGFKDTVDLFEKQYFWRETPIQSPKQEKKEVIKIESAITKNESKEISKGDNKETTKIESKEETTRFEKKEEKEPSKQENPFILKKHYTVLALTDFDYASMKDNDKWNLARRIQDDLGIGEEVGFGETVIVVLLRGSEDNRWPIYGLFTLRNFRQVMQFVADSLIDQPGYPVEYKVDPSKYTIKLLDRFNKNPYRAKLTYGCLANPDRTLTIYNSEMGNNSNLRAPLVTVDYNKESFYVADRQKKKQSTEWVDSSPFRWDGQVLSMLYEMFEFNRNTPTVSTPSVSIAK